MTALEISLFSLLVFSLIGIAVILFKKAPVLVELPEVDNSGESLASAIKRGVMEKIPGAKKIDYELHLQKMVSRIHVLTLKTENKTSGWLERLRKRRNGHNHDDGYWEELKKAKDGK